MLVGWAAPIFRMNLTVFGELMLCFGEQYSRELSVVSQNKVPHAFELARYVTGLYKWI